MTPAITRVSKALSEARKRHGRTDRLERRLRVLVANKLRREIAARVKPRTGGSVMDLFGRGGR